MTETPALTEAQLDELERLLTSVKAAEGTGMMVAMPDTVCAALIAEARRSRAEIARLRAALDWQDISTAPRDGADILVIVQGGHPQTGVPFTPEVVSWDGREWWGVMWSSDEHVVYEPTHWMPLPPPPALAQEGGANG